MGTSVAKMVFSNGVSLSGWYQNTADVLHDQFFAADPAANLGDLRKRIAYIAACGKCEEEPCIVHVDYGGGMWWRGTGCQKCGRFHGERLPYEQSHRDVSEIEEIHDGDIPADAFDRETRKGQA